MDWGKENRYPIVAGSWVLSMGVALGIVGRSPHLSTQQKLVQARVYAQGLTIAVLIATAAFEVGDRGKGEGRWETVKIIDPNDPEHKHLIEKKVHHERYEGEDQWRGRWSIAYCGGDRKGIAVADGAYYSDMVEAEERKMKERETALKEQEKQEEANHKSKHKDNEHHGKKKPHKEEKDSGGDKKGK